MGWSLAALTDGRLRALRCFIERAARFGLGLSAIVRSRRVRRRREERAFAYRNAQLTPLQRLGRTEWKVRSGYSQRSFVESTNHRLKSL